MYNYSNPESRTEKQNKINPKKNLKDSKTNVQD